MVVELNQFWLDYCIGYLSQTTGRDEEDPKLQKAAQCMLVIMVANQQEVWVPPKQRSCCPDPPPPVKLYLVKD